MNTNVDVDKIEGFKNTAQELRNLIKQDGKMSAARKRIHNIYAFLMLIMIAVATFFGYRILYSQYKYEQAISAYEKKDWMTVYQLLQELEYKNSDVWKSQAAYYLGEAAYIKGDFVEAVRYLKENADEDSMRLWAASEYKFGEKFMDTKNYIEALSYFNNAADISAKISSGSLIPESEIKIRITEVQNYVNIAEKWKTLDMIVNYATPEMQERYPIPVFSNTVTESSYLIQKDKMQDNHGWRAFDGDMNSNWQEGASGNGIGEYLNVNFGQKCNIKMIVFKLGNHKSERWFTENNVPKVITIDMDGHRFPVEFPYEMSAYAVTLSESVDISSICFTIDEVYPGTKYQDTVITDIIMYGE